MFKMRLAASLYSKTLMKKGNVDVERVSIYDSLLLFSNSKSLSKFLKNYEFIKQIKNWGQIPQINIKDSAFDRQRCYTQLEYLLIFLLMILQGEEETRGSKLVLPPVSRFQKPRHQQPIHQIMSILSRKKQQYEQELQMQQPNDQQYNLQYARTDLQANPGQSSLTNMEILQEQFLARGSFIDQSQSSKPNQRNKLIVMQNAPSRKPHVQIFTRNIRQARASEQHQNRYRSLEVRGKQEKGVDTTQLKQQLDQSPIKILDHTYKQQQHSSQFETKQTNLQQIQEKRQESNSNPLRRIEEKHINLQRMGKIERFQKEKHQRHERNKRLLGIQIIKKGNQSQKEVINEEGQRQLVHQSSVDHKKYQINGLSNANRYRTKTDSSLAKDRKNDILGIKITEHNINYQRFIQAVTQMKKTSKTNDRLQRVARCLELFNPFFRKIQRVVSVCLLRVGRIKFKLAQQPLYQMNEPYQFIYIILLGQVKIIGKNGLHKVCQPGETLLDELMNHPEGKQKVLVVSLEKAKVLQDSWLLQIDRSQLYKLQKQLNKYGFRQGLNEMKTLIKRNSIVKNWLRNKFRLLQNNY